MLVREVMSTDVVTCDAGTTLDVAVGEMIDRGVGSVVVTRGGEPAGIVTESDALRAAHRSDRPLSSIPVSGLAGGPLSTIAPDAPVERAADRMADRGCKKLPVVDALELVGIVTLTDIVLHLSDIRREASRAAKAHYEWEH